MGGQKLNFWKLEKRRRKAGAAIKVRKEEGEQDSS